MPRPRIIQPWLPEATLLGLEQSRQRIERQIPEVQRLLAPRARRTPAPATRKPERTISAASRKRMAVRPILSDFPGGGVCDGGLARIMAIPDAESGNGNAEETGTHI